MGHLSDYRTIWSDSLRKAQEQVFGNAEALEAAEAQRARLATYYRNPVGFARDVLGQTTWKGSRGILNALNEHRMVHVSGCRKSTKSHTSAQAALWFFASGPARIIVTSATFEQVRDNVFARIRSLHMRSKVPLPGRLGVTSLRMESDPTWFAKGISTNRPGNIQGYHADVTLDPRHELDDESFDPGDLPAPDPRLVEEDLARKDMDPAEAIDREVWDAKRQDARLLFILDEMREIDADIVETLAGSWMGSNVYVLSQFNPTFAPDDSHPAARFLRPGSGFHRIHIAGREPPEDMHPAGMFDACFHGVPRELMPDEWVERQLRLWGETSALACAHVFGLPASVDRERQIIPFRLIRAAFDRPWRSTGNVYDKHMGWDVAASESGDFNVLSLRDCGKLVAQKKWHCADTLESADLVMDQAREWGGAGRPIPGCNIHVDKIGVGDGPVRHMRRKGFNVDAVDFGAAAVGDRTDLTGDAQFVNRKTELVWQARRELQELQADIPREFPETIRQAQWQTLKESPRAAGTALAIAEKKEDLRKLYGQSPDEFDSYVLTCSRTSQEAKILPIKDVSDLWAMFGG